jgi:hypothetical protein
MLPDIVALCRDLLEDIPPNCASMQIEKEPEGEEIVHITPRAPDAAPVSARGGRYGYELVVGEGTSFEVLPEGKCYTEFSADEEVRAICEAIFAGKFSETLIYAGKTLVRTIASLEIGGKDVRLNLTHGYRPLFPKTRKHIKYEPYWTSEVPNDI